MYADIVISKIFNLNKHFFFLLFSMDWHGACIVPMYKRKDDKCECSNSRGVSLLSVVGKLIKRVRAGTECAIGEEQCGFLQGRESMDHMFAVRKVCEKYLSNGKDVFWAFMDWRRHMIRSISTACDRC